jgi:hypothetical protein
MNSTNNLISFYRMRTLIIYSIVITIKSITSISHFIYNRQNTEREQLVIVRNVRINIPHYFVLDHMPRITSFFASF